MTLRLVSYGRVSRVGGREGPSFVSPAIQREGNEAYATVKGWEIVDHIEDLDVSGGTIDRPGFQRALAMIESGEAGGMIVPKLDRFARTMLGAHQALERIEKAGGRFVSVADNFDLGTPTGRLMFNIMASFAAFERDRLTIAWREIQERKVGEGVPTGVPWGYERGEDRRLIPTEEGRRWVPAIFARRGAGESLRAVAAWLNDEGVQTRSGRWSFRTVDVLLKQRAYLGEVKYGDLVNPEAHEPLVELPAWLAAQGGVRRESKSRSQGLLVGLLRCASCRYTMDFRKGNGRPVYQCRGKHGSGICPAPTTVSASKIEPYVWAWAMEQMESERTGVLVEANAKPQLEARVAEARANLSLFEDDLDLLRIMGKDRYTSQLRRLVEALTEAERASGEAYVAGEMPAITELRIAGIPERRLALSHGIDCVFLRGRPGHGRTLPIETRVLVLGRGLGPRPKDLPRCGDSSAYTLRPFPFPDEPEASARVAAA